MVAGESNGGRCARLFNPNNQIVVVLSNRSGMLTAEHTGWVKDYRAVLLTMESLEATAFTAADWLGYYTFRISGHRCIALRKVSDGPRLATTHSTPILPQRGALYV